MSKETASYLFNDAQDHTTNYEIDNIQWNYRDDIKSRNYQDNTTQFDFSDLANSTNYTSYNMWSLIFPWTMKIGGVLHTEAENDFALSLKASILDAINTVKIDINEVTMNQPTSYSNLANNFNLTKMSEDELKTVASLINFSPDSTKTIRRINTTPGPPAVPNPSVFAPTDTEYNNNIQALPTLVDVAGANVADVVTSVNDNLTDVLNSAFDWTAGGFSMRGLVNTGRVQRMNETSFNPERESISTYYTVGNATSSRQSHVHLADADTIIYYGYSFIPLGLIHPFFKTCPPIRGAKLKLYIQLNVNLKYTIDTTGDVYNSIVTNSYGPGSNMCPVQISPLNSGVVPKAAGTALTIEFLAGSVGGTGTVEEGLRMRYPMIQLSPDFENEYLKDSVKKGAFQDYVVYPNLTSLGSLAAGQSATNIAITNSISRLRSILIIPQSIDGDNSPSYSKPFSSAPFTTAPYALPTNLQIQVNNRNVFAQPINYTYEMYLEHMQNSSVGKLSELGLASGFISKQDFERGMGYVYFDLKNSRYDEEDKLSVPVNITITNPSKYAVKYVVVLFNEKRYECDCAKGSFVVVN